jgi:hypothetical protein
LREYSITLTDRENLKATYAVWRKDLIDTKTAYESYSEIELLSCSVSPTFEYEIPDEEPKCDESSNVPEEAQ